MKCPHCEYQEGWNPTTLKEDDNHEGAFFRHPLDMIRPEIYGRYEDTSAALLGCPRCLKTFIVPYGT